MCCAERQTLTWSRQGTSRRIYVFIAHIKLDLHSLSLIKKYFGRPLSDVLFLWVRTFQEGAPHPTASRWFWWRHHGTCLVVSRSITLLVWLDNLTPPSLPRNTNTSSAVGSVLVCFENADSSPAVIVCTSSFIYAKMSFIICSYKFKIINMYIYIIDGCVNWDLIFSNFFFNLNLHSKLHNV